MIQIIMKEEFDDEMGSGEQVMPINLECDYCKKNTQHGGECYQTMRRNTSIPCLGFDQDPRGTIKYGTDQTITIKINQQFPAVGKWIEDYSVGGKDTPVKFTKIVPVKWITNRNIAIQCKIWFDYYDNSEYEEDGEMKLAPVLQLVRKQGG